VIIDGIFKCQECGNTRAMLTRDLETGRCVCYDRELCAAFKLLEFRAEFDG